MNDWIDEKIFNELIEERDPDLDLLVRDIDVNDIKKEKKEKPKGITETTNITFSELANKVEEFVPNTRTALKISLAVAASSSKRGTPMLWVILVGNPSSGKTEIVTLLRESFRTYFLDSMTMSAFISGERSQRNKKVYDLLPQLDKKCFVIKDWTTLFSLYEEMTSKIIGDLVNIYDEEFTKFSAARGRIEYKSNFSHLGCITPATLNKHVRYLNMIGARFLFYLIPSLSEEQEEKSFDSIFNNQKRRKMKKELSVLTSKFLNKISLLSIKNIKPLSEEVKIYLKTASRFIAKARGLVITQVSSFKNEEGEEITYYEPLEIQIEQPFRALQQLIRLSKYLALVEEKDEVGIEELEIIKEIALSSMPANRASALSIFKNKEIKEISAKDLSDYSEKTGITKSVKTARRLLDELVFLGILEKEKGIGSIASNFHLITPFDIFVSETPSDFLSSYSKLKNGITPNDIKEIFGS
jgi:hypothetical protein